MDYTEAVRLARAGEQSGYNILYEKTYQKKYFLALQYMKNETAAEDVMQEAYIRAFSKLDTLEEPEKFPSWLGMIVMNMAKNALKKNNLMLFSDIAADDGREVFEYQIEDDNVEHMPEIAYTREETRRLTHELLDSLSEEQRMCVLMFHIDGLSIKEIASTLGCSENTVKSRLKYGRDNIKEKGEELQKKGYQLYSVAPLPLFIYLLQMEASYMKAEGSLTAAGVRISKRVLPSYGMQGSAGAGASGAARKAAGSSIKTAKSGFIHTTAVKATAAVIGLSLIGGGAVYVVSQMNTDETVVQSEEGEERKEAKKEEKTPNEAAAKEPVSEKTPVQEPVSEEPSTPEAMPQFPAGQYFSMSDGSYRGTLTIDSVGIAVCEELSGGTGQGREIMYKMAADDTATAPDGMTAYSLQFIEGNEIQLTDSGREVTGHLDSGDDWGLYYDANTRTIQDTYGATWTFNE